jgi:hypothetical protein
MASFPGQQGWVGKVVITNLTVPVGAKEYPNSQNQTWHTTSRAGQASQAVKDGGRNKCDNVKMQRKTERERGKKKNGRKMY